MFRDQLQGRAGAEHHYEPNASLYPAAKAFATEWAILDMMPQGMGLHPRAPHLTQAEQNPRPMAVDVAFWCLHGTRFLMFSPHMARLAGK